MSNKKRQWLCPTIKFEEIKDDVLTSSTGIGFADDRVWAVDPNSFFETEVE